MQDKIGVVTEYVVRAFVHHASIVLMLHDASATLCIGLYVVNYSV